MVKRNALKTASQASPPKKNLVDPDEKFQDETSLIAGSAIENYFMQGKSAAERMNTGRVKKRIAAETMEVDENEEHTSIDSSFLDCNLEKLRDYIQTRNKSEKSEKFLDDLDEKWMSKWALYMASGFNILLHGIGSKREVLTRFAKSDLEMFTWMRVDATREEMTPKVLLANINENLHLNLNGKGMPAVEWARQISQKMVKSNLQLILLIDNIEAPDWRNEQDVLCALLENNHAVKLIATIDHIYSTFIWNSRQLSALKFVHLTVNTFDMPLQELINGNSRILGLDAKFKQSCHTVGSLEVFWKSLTSNSQKLFILFLKMYFSTKKPVNFWDLFNAARDDYIVSTDTALRTQIVEFKDHRIIRWSRGDDGSDQLSAMVDHALITKFLESKGLSLTEEEGEEAQE